MKTIKTILQQSTAYLEEKGIDSPRRGAERMLSSVLNLPRMDLYLDFEKPLTDEELAACRDWLKRLGEGRPVQYLEGSVPFYGCDIEVNGSVLIPRPETEELVDKIVHELGKRPLEGKKLWDLCTGSGCIGIALKKALPGLEVTVSDLSPEALETARSNCGKNGVEIRCLQGDLFVPFGEEKADFIVSNPPYVSEAEYAGLESHVKDHEPKMAFDGGMDGLDICRRIAKDLKHALLPCGKLWMEIGSGQGDEVKKIFEAEGWAKLRVEQDITGNNRFFFLENE